MDVMMQTTGTATELQRTLSSRPYPVPAPRPVPYPA